MLDLTLNGVEVFNESSGEFETCRSIDLRLEHSLISISRWESKWKKPFLTKTEKTWEETMDYIYCMSLFPIKQDIRNQLTTDFISMINDYIDDKSTATTFSSKSSASREIITSEIIYYWMVSFRIPFECEKWHLNRLLTLIKVCDLKSEKPKKMSRRELLSRNARINNQRKKGL